MGRSHTGAKATSYDVAPGLGEPPRGGSANSVSRSSGATSMWTLARSSCRSMATRESRSPQPRPSASVMSASVNSDSRIGTPTSLTERGGQADVLVSESKGERRPVEAMRKKLVSQTVEGPASTIGAITQRPPEGERVDSGFHSDREHFGNRGVKYVSDAVVHELGDGPAAERSDVQDLVAEGAEHSSVGVDGALVASRVNGELALARPVRSTTHRGVADDGAHGEKPLVYLPYGRHRVRGEVEVGLPRLSGRNQALRPQRHRMDIIRFGEGGKGHLGRSHDLGRGAGPHRARSQVGLGRFRPQIVNDQIMSGGLEMGRHVPAHGTEADKSDFHAGMLLQVGDAEDIVAGSHGVLGDSPDIDLHRTAGAAP